MGQLGHQHCPWYALKYKTESKIGIFKTMLRLRLKKKDNIKTMSRCFKNKKFEGEGKKIELERKSDGK